MLPPGRVARPEAGLGNACFDACLFQFGLMPGLAAVLAESEGGALSGGWLKRSQQIAEGGLAQVRQRGT